MEQNASKQEVWYDGPSRVIYLIHMPSNGTQFFIIYWLIVVKASAFNKHSFTNNRDKHTENAYQMFVKRALSYITTGNAWHAVIVVVIVSCVKRNCYSTRLSTQKYNNKWCIITWWLFPLWMCWFRMRARLGFSACLTGIIMAGTLRWLENVNSCFNACKIQSLCINEMFDRWQIG